MKPVIAVVTLIMCLSFPVLAGHTQTGYGNECECIPVGSVCQCCGAKLSVATNQENVSINQNASDGAGLGVIRLAFMMWLKLKA